MRHKVEDSKILDEIFKSDKNSELKSIRDNFALPAIQRHASWTSREIKFLFDEIKSLYCCNVQRLSNGENRWRRNIGDLVVDNRSLIQKTGHSVFLIDGQQRSTNVSVLLAVIRDIIEERFSGNAELMDIKTEIESNYLTRREGGSLFPKITLKDTLNNSYDLHKVIVERDFTYIKGNIDKDIHNVLYIYNEWRKKIKQLNEDELKDFYHSGLKFLTMSVHYIEEDHEINEEFLKRNSNLGKGMSGTQKCNALVASFVDEMNFSTPNEKGQVTKNISKLVSNESVPFEYTMYNAKYTKNSSGRSILDTSEQKYYNRLNDKIEYARCMGDLDDQMKLISQLSKAASNVYGILTRTTGTEFDNLASMYSCKNDDALLVIPAIELFGIGGRHTKGLSLTAQVEMFDLVFGLNLRSKIYRGTYLGTQEKTAIPKIFDENIWADKAGHLKFNRSIDPTSNILSRLFPKVITGFDTKASFIQELCYTRLTPGLRNVYCCILSRINYEMSGRTEIVDWMDASKNITLEHVIAQSVGPDDVVNRLGNLVFLERDLNSGAGTKNPVDKVSIYSKSSITMTKKLNDLYPLDQFDVNMIDKRSEYFAGLIYDFINNIYPKC